MRTFEDCIIEWVEYRTPEEREEGIVYLNLWAKFSSRKQADIYVFHPEGIIDKPNVKGPGIGTLGMLIFLREVDDII